MTWSMSRPAVCAKGRPSERPWTEARDADLVDHLGELAVAGGSQQFDAGGERANHGLCFCVRVGVAAAHDSQLAVLRAGLAAGHGASMKYRPLAVACAASSRATMAEVVVWSMTILLGAAVLEIPTRTGHDLAQVIVVADAGKRRTRHLSRHLQACAAASPPYSFCQAAALAGVRL